MDEAFFTWLFALVDSWHVCWKDKAERGKWWMESFSLLVLQNEVGITVVVTPHCYFNRWDPKTQCTAKRLHHIQKWDFGYMQHESQSCSQPFLLQNKYHLELASCIHFISCSISQLSLFQFTNRHWNTWFCITRWTSIKFDIPTVSWRSNYTTVKSRVLSGTQT